MVENFVRDENVHNVCFHSCKVFHFTMSMCRTHNFSLELCNILRQPSSAECMLKKSILFHNYVNQQTSNTLIFLLPCHRFNSFHSKGLIKESFAMTAAGVVVAEKRCRKYLIVCSMALIKYDAGLGDGMPELVF